jgi:hypothetical protein
MTTSGIDDLLFHWSKWAEHKGREAYHAIRARDAFFEHDNEALKSVLQKDDADD